MDKKICMLGASAVGKTSLVSQFVHNYFPKKYQTTMGVKINTKKCTVDNQEIHLAIWDIYGEDEFQQVQLSYLRGSQGYLLVVDGTRPSTLDTSLALRQKVEEAGGQIPNVLLINKSDLKDDWAIEDHVMNELSAQGWTIILTSAKTGENVEEAFVTLTRRMMTTA